MPTSIMALSPFLKFKINLLLKFFISDDPSTLWAEAALTDLEGIDDDLDDHKIIFVKMSDVREGR